MPVATKFMFDTIFEPVSDTGHATSASARIFSQAEFETAKENAFAEGRAGGFTEAAAATERLTAETLGSIAARLQALAEETAAHEAERSRGAISIAGVALAKVLPALARRHGFAEIESLVTDCLSRLSEEPRLVVRVHDDNLDPLRHAIDRIAAGSDFAGRVVLLADSALAATDARVEWADGGVERDVQRITAEIDAIVAKFLETWSAAEAADR